MRLMYIMELCAYSITLHVQTDNLEFSFVMKCNTILLYVTSRLISLTSDPSSDFENQAFDYDTHQRIEHAIKNHISFRVTLLWYDISHIQQHPPLTLQSVLLLFDVFSRAPLPQAPKRPK